MWDEMLTKSVETNKALESKGITGEKLAESVKTDSRTETDNKSGEDVQYMSRDGETKNAEELTEDDLRYLLENVQNGIYDNDTYLPLRISTPEFFIDVVRVHSEGKYNVMHVPMASRVKHLRQNMDEEDGASYGNKRPHNLSVDDIITISKEMGHPAYIVLQKNRRYAMVVSFYNGNSQKVLVSIDFASDKDPTKNYKYKQYMNGFNEGYYNIVVTQYSPDDFSKYLADNEVVYDKKKMNGKYQVGSGRIVTFTHDTPFIDDSILNPGKKVKKNVTDVQNQDRYISSIYDIMGESEKLRKTNELLKADVERLKELVMLERKLTHGKVFKGVSLEVVLND